MTIRYTCPGCQSQLKIRDEKAGTDAKCPKCRRAFVVPEPDADDGIEIEDAAANAPAADLPIDLPVDMPIELTPEVSSPEAFDAGNFLTSSPAATPARPAAAPATPASSAAGRKPSVAELMKDFESTKKSKDRDKGRKSAEPPRGASSAETTGSAADALARAYPQKLDTASAPPPLAPPSLIIITASRQHPSTISQADVQTKQQQKQRMTRMMSLRNLD
ncbi:MAG: hypothetical protein ACKO2P_11420, partial [Planctomycetota bacterium]